VQEQFKILLTSIPLLIEEILKNYNTLGKKYYLKDDYSPVTELDLFVNEWISEKLKEISPEIPIVSEEKQISLYELEYFWLIDPIDGTQEVIEDSKEFACNIAFIKNGKPIFGVVVVPFDNSFYYATEGGGAFYSKNGYVKSLSKEKISKGKLIIAISRNVELTYFKSTLGNFDLPYDILLCGSAIKFCLLAENKADIYIRFANTCIWDTAAPEVILVESGGLITNINSNPLVYDHEIINPSFIALSRRAKGLHSKIISCG